MAGDRDDALECVVAVTVPRERAPSGWPAPSAPVPRGGCSITAANIAGPDEILFPLSEENAPRHRLFLCFPPAISRNSREIMRQDNPCPIAAAEPAAVLARLDLPLILRSSDTTTTWHATVAAHPRSTPAGPDTPETCQREPHVLSRDLLTCTMVASGRMRRLLDACR